MGKIVDRQKHFLKKQLRDLPFQLGAASLAILIGIAEGAIINISNILEGPSAGLKKRFDRLAGRKTFWDYYDELKNIKENNARVIFYRLKKKGLIENKNGCYKLTSLGLKYSKKILEAKPRRWDGKWRIVSFDIPEKLKREREWLRTELLVAGFLSLQKSVFIGKWPLDEEFFKEIARRNLNRFIKIMSVGEIDDEEILKQLD